MKVRGLLAATALLLVTGMPADAQQGAWSAYHGCWQGTDLSVPAGEYLCILPGDDALSVRLATVAQDRIVNETVLRADGVERPVEEGGCKGTQRAAFSADGKRIYTRTAMDCGAGTISRTSTGVFAMVSDVEWIDAQALTVEGQHATRTMRFRAVPTSRLDAAIAALLPADQRLAQEALRLHASAPLGTEQIVEATKMVAAPVVEAVLAARQQGFDLDAKALRQLKSAGVPTSTIDVMVALSYPSHFAVAEQVATQSPMAPMAPMESYRPNECRYDPFTGRRYCDEFGYGYGYGYGYSRYGNGYSNYYPWQNRRDPIIVVINPTDAASGGSVVKGKGYTRGNSGSGSTPTSSDSRPRTATPSSPPSSSSGGSSTTSSRGSTSSGSSETPVRTAKPRTGGGDH